MNLPNAITIARIALIPVFLILAFRDSNAATAAALVVFLVASLSDYIDGYIARRDETVSRAGQFLDPTADKLLVGAALIVIVVERSFPIWAALLLAAREVVVQVVRTNIVRAGGTLPASPVGKIKTFSHVVMVVWWLLPWEQPNIVHWLLLGEALIFSFVSGAEYVMRRPKKQHVSEPAV